MGFHTGYVLVKDVSRDELSRRLGAALGDRVEEPDVREAPVCVAPTKGAWTVDTPPNFRQLIDEARAQEADAPYVDH